MNWPPSLLARALHFTLVTLFSGSVLSAQQAVPVVRIKPANAWLREEFSNLAIHAVRELHDGRILIAETGADSRLIVGDLAAGTVTPIGRKGQGPGEYTVAASIFPLAGDSSLLLAASRRWLLLDGARIVATTAPTDVAVGAVSIVQGADRTGAVLGSTHRLGHREDSTEIGLVSRRTGAVTPVAMLAESNEPGYPPPSTHPAPGTVLYFHGPWMTGEGANLSEDGWVAVVRLAPYRVDWRSPAGAWTRGSPLEVAPMRVDEREKRGYMDRLAATSGAPVRPTTTYPVWPRFVPPVQNTSAMVGTPDGRVLIQRTPTVDHPETRYDVVNRAGRLERQVILERGSRILYIGARWAFVAEVDSDGVERIARHPWP